MDLNLQQMPCFCSRMVFLCFWRYEGWLNRALGQLGCMEDENKVCFGLCLQEMKVGLSLQGFFYVKQKMCVMCQRPVQAILYAANKNLAPL